MTKRTVFMLLLSIGLILGLSSVACASDWPTFQKNNYNNGIVDGVAPSTDSFTNVWSDTISGGGWVGWDGAPIIANGNVYDIYFNGYVYAYNLTSGTNVWINSQVGGGVGTFELSTAAYDLGNDRLFVALSNGNSSTTTSVHAINGVTGATIWSNTDQSYFPAGHQFNSGIKYEDDKVYVATYATSAGTFTCLNATTGEVVWQYVDNNNGFYWATPAIIGDYAVIGCEDGIVRSFNKDTGVLVDSEDAGYGAIRGGITYDENTGRIYFTTTGKYVVSYAFSTSTGAFSGMDYVNHGTRMTTTPTVTSNGHVFISDDAGYITCYRTDLTEISTSEDLGSLKASPVVYTYIDDGMVFDYVYYTSNNANYQAGCALFVDGTYDGGSLVNFGPSAYTLQGVAIVDGYIVFGNDMKYIGCFN